MRLAQYNVAAASRPPRCTPERAAELLSALDDAHCELLASMTEMGLATSRTEPDPSRYVNLRWKLSRASRARRALVQSIHVELAGCVTPAEAAGLEELQAMDAAMLRATAQHVRTWTVEAINADWRGYCRASKLIRSKMREGIEAEKAILYPLLRARARQLN